MKKIRRMGGVLALLVRGLVWGLALSAFAGAAYAGSASLSESRAVVTHIVFVWMAEGHRTPQDIQRLIDGEQTLRKIPGLLSMKIGRAVPGDRPNVDGSFDVATSFRFRSVAAMHDYLKNPLHLQFLKDDVKGKVGKILIYDIQEP